MGAHPEWSPATFRADFTWLWLKGRYSQCRAVWQDKPTPEGGSILRRGLLDRATLLETSALSAGAGCSRLAAGAFRQTVLPKL